MQKNTFKKIISSVYLLIFLFSLSFPFYHIFAQNASNPLLITATPLTKTESGIFSVYSSKITAKVYSNVGGEKISFSTKVGSSSFTPQECAIPTGNTPRSCSVDFKTTSTAGLILIEASTTIDGKKASVSISLSKGAISPVVVPADNTGVAPPVLIPDETPKVNTKTTYEPLAPLPGFPSEFDTLASESNKCPFGNYLNIMIKLIIGIAAILAMVMITMGGIEYMSSELISGKESGKETIRNAIFGLLIALGSYLILNTINPNLLNVCLDNLPKAEILIDDEVELEPNREYTNLSAPSGNCKTGYININTGNTPQFINVCKDFNFAYNLNNLIQAAKKDGIILSGYGSRSSATQIELRKRHKCPDIYNSPSESCTPPTARPGRSMHESGLAVDFTCNGKGMTESGGKNSPCYKWLVNNATSKFYIKNYSKETWHWSINGR